MGFDYQFFQKSVDFLKQKISFTPEIAVVLGSSLGPLADRIQDPVTVDYGDIPNFLLSTAPSQAGKMIFGTLGGKKVMCLSGRFHFYEGYSFEQLVIPVRVMKLMGVRAAILTNAAGASNPAYRPGDVMVISDHIKLVGDSPLRGKNLPEFGPRFFSTCDMYTPAFRELALRCAEGSGLTVHEGVYFFFAGPQFETPAEIRAARLLGADAVGMSTVTEALTAAHCGLPVLGLSVLTNMAAGMAQTGPSGSEVDETAALVSDRFSEYVEKIIREM